MFNTLPCELVAQNDNKLTKTKPLSQTLSRMRTESGSVKQYLTYNQTYTFLYHLTTDETKMEQIDEVNRAVATQAVKTILIRVTVIKTRQS